MSTSQNHLEGLIRQMINEELQGLLQPCIRKIEEMETKLDSIQENDSSPYLSRQRLAAELNCSGRFLRDNSAFKCIEHRVGGRVFYLRDEVEVVIRNG